MTFSEYLISKKIDEASFRKADDQQWSYFNELFQQMHPKSFTAQKLFLINEMRKNYPLKSIATNREGQVEEAKSRNKKILRPIAKPLKPTIKKPKMK